MRGRFVVAMAFAGLVCSACPGRDGNVPPRSTPAWASIAQGLALQQEIAAGSVRGRVFVAGGYTPDGMPTGRASAFDPTSGRWTALPDLPVAVHHPAGATWNGSFVVAGGIRADGGPSNRVLAYDGTTWRDLPPLRHARGAAAAAQVGTMLVVAGGVASGSEVAVSEIFDGTSWRDGAPIPTPRDHLSGASDGALFYAALGRAAGKHTTTFESFDPASNTWRTLPNVPGHVRSGGGAAFVARTIVVAGGESDQAYRDVYAFDPRTKAWNALPPMAVARHGFGLVAAGETLFALLGANAPGLAPVRTCERLDV